jgi:hypothetical protein
MSTDYFLGHSSLKRPAIRKKKLERRNCCNLIRTQQALTYLAYKVRTYISYVYNATAVVARGIIYSPYMVLLKMYT